MKISRWGILEITREKIDFLQMQGFDSALKSDLITKTLPFGTPEGESLKYVILNGIIYLSYISVDHLSGKGIIIALDPRDELDIIAYIPKLRDILKNPPSPLTTEFELSPSIATPSPLKIKNFDIAVFSCLSRLRTIILGENTAILSVISVICASIPEKMRTRLEFVTQSTSLSENVNIIGMPMNDDVLTELNELKGDYTLIMLKENKVYGKYSSKICKKIASLAEKGEFNTIKTILGDFYVLALGSQDISPALEFAKTHNLQLSDAQLALIMRAHFYNKPVPKELLEVK